MTTGSDGVILGGAGGHSDTAAGAKLTIVTTRLAAGGNLKIVERVGTVSTPGDFIDVLVTEEGIAVNSMRDDLRERLLAQGLPVVGMEQLRARAALQAPARAPIDRTSRPAALVEYRDGTVIDVVNTIG